MSYFNTKKEFSLRDLLYRALIFIGTVAVSYTHLTLPTILLV